jgi:hypothetical protein
VSWRCLWSRVVAGPVRAPMWDLPTRRTRRNADGLVDIADRVDAAPTGECALFDDNCPNQDGCYPDEELSGQTRCRPAGAFPVLVGCLLQNDCAPAEACIEVPGPGAVCLLLCRPSAPEFSCLDVNGSTCRSLVRYPGVGYCL